MCAHPAFYCNDWPSTTEHFGSYDQVTEDAKATLEGYADGYFDVIILDLCDPLDYGPCYTLYSREFYDTCAQKLSPNGMFTDMCAYQTLHLTLAQ